MVKVRNLIAICISLIIVSLIFTGISHAKIDLKNAVAIYLFDEGNDKKVKDSTGNGNDGDFVGNPQWVDGKFGKALSFNGQDDYVQISTPANISSKVSTFTIGFWVNPGDTQKQYTDILSNHQEPQKGYTFEQDSTNINLFYCGFGSDGAWRAGVPQVDRALTQLKAGIWQHFAAVREGTKLTHYLNGNKSVECPTNTSAPVSESQANLRIGEWGGSSGRQFNGILDEIFIFNDALNEADIKVIMNSGINGALSVSPSDKLAVSWGMIKAQ
jgi:hypothetical protein